MADDLWRLRLDEVKRERDEARAENDSLAELLSEAIEATKAAEAEAEYWKGRAQSVARIVADYKAGRENAAS